MSLACFWDLVLLDMIHKKTTIGEGWNVVRPVNRELSLFGLASSPQQTGTTPSLLQTRRGPDPLICLLLSLDFKDSNL